MTQLLPPPKPTPPTNTRRRITRPPPPVAPLDLPPSISDRPLPPLPPSPPPRRRHSRRDSQTLADAGVGASVGELIPPTPASPDTVAAAQALAHLGLGRNDGPYPEAVIADAVGRPHDSPRRGERRRRDLPTGYLVGSRLFPPSNRTHRRHSSAPESDPPPLYSRDDPNPAPPIDAPVLPPLAAPMEDDEEGEPAPPVLLDGVIPRAPPESAERRASHGDSVRARPQSEGRRRETGLPDRREGQFSLDSAHANVAPARRDVAGNLEGARRHTQASLETARRDVHAGLETAKSEIQGAVGEAAAAVKHAFGMRRGGGGASGSGASHAAQLGREAFGHPSRAASSAQMEGRGVSQM